jgi:hypothetical protein
VGARFCKFLLTASQKLIRILAGSLHLLATNIFRRIDPARALLSAGNHFFDFPIFGITRETMTTNRGQVLLLPKAEVHGANSGNVSRLKVYIIFMAYIAKGCTALGTETLYLK